MVTKVDLEELQKDELSEDAIAISNSCKDR